MNSRGSKKSTLGLKIISPADLGVIIVNMMLIAIFIGLLVTACSHINQELGLDPDHPVEEMIEDMIEHETGLEIDLTPGSIEGLE